MGARVIGIGAALPERVVTNDDLAATMDTSDSWIRERTGIHERRIGSSTSVLAIESARAAMEMAGVHSEDIGLLILSTSTPDKCMPATASEVSAELNLTCGGFDINAACAGFAYGFIVASSMMKSPTGLKRLLLIGADSLSNIIDWTDRSTAILFADGGGAVVLEYTNADTLLGWDCATDGKYASILYCDHGSTVVMEGREVFKVAVRAVADSIATTLEKADIRASDVDVLLPHQANIRIIEAVCKRTGIDFAKSFNVIAHTGNNSSATIPLSMTKAHESGVLLPGSIVVMTGFGAGMTWATTVVRW